MFFYVRTCLFWQLRAFDTRACQHRQRWFVCEVFLCCAWFSSLSFIVYTCACALRISVNTIIIIIIICIHQWEVPSREHSKWYREHHMLLLMFMKCIFLPVIFHHPMHYHQLDCGCCHHCVWHWNCLSCDEMMHDCRLVLSCCHSHVAREQQQQQPPPPQQTNVTHVTLFGSAQGRSNTTYTHNHTHVHTHTWTRNTQAASTSRDVA